MRVSQSRSVCQCSSCCVSMCVSAWFVCKTIKVRGTQVLSKPRLSHRVVRCRSPPVPVLPVVCSDGIPSEKTATRNSNNNNDKNRHQNNKRKFGSRSLPCSLSRHFPSFSVLFGSHSHNRRAHALRDKARAKTGIWNRILNR